MSDWREVLQLNSLELTEEQITAQYRRLAKVRHPDIGGTQEAMTELNQATQEALRYLAESALRVIPVLNQQQSNAYQQAVINAWQQQVNAQNTQRGYMNSMLGGMAGMGAQQAQAVQDWNARPHTPHSYSKPSAQAQSIPAEHRPAYVEYKPVRTPSMWRKFWNSR